MNIVKITNKIALTSVVLLIYWVFIFVSKEVFGFKVFRENMTEIFSLSILGIFAILFGSLILNIMFNLTAIAENRSKEEKLVTKGSYKKHLALFFSSLVIIFLLLYVGDLATSQKKENYLVSSASDLLVEQKEVINRLSNYSFSREYIERASKDIRLLSKIEEKFPQITVIVRDSIDNKNLLLGFGQYSGLGINEIAEKTDYILSTSSEERTYLNSVFDGHPTKHRFSSNDGKYEIYYPVKTDKGIIVIYLSQYSRYGKLGS